MRSRAAHSRVRITCRVLAVFPWRVLEIKIFVLNGSITEPTHSCGSDQPGPTDHHALPIHKPKSGVVTLRCFPDDFEPRLQFEVVPQSEAAAAADAPQYTRTAVGLAFISGDEGADVRISFTNTFEIPGLTTEIAWWANTVMMASLTVAALTENTEVC